MLEQVWDRIRCLFHRCPPDPPGLPRDTLRRMEAIPKQLDRIIEKRIRNNIIESAYLERLRREGEAHER